MWDESDSARSSMFQEIVRAKSWFPFSNSPKNFEGEDLKKQNRKCFLKLASINCSSDTMKTLNSLGSKSINDNVYQILQENTQDTLKTFFGYK